MKRPSFQFYPGDWLSEPAVQMISPEAEGLYIRLLCHMHQGDERGFLIIKNVILSEEKIQKIQKFSKKKFEKYFFELKKFGLILQDKRGAYYNPRMVKDAHIERVRAEAGVKGGNPNLLNQNSNQTNKQNPTPSSSTSTSTSMNTNLDTGLQSEFIAASSSTQPQKAKKKTSEPQGFRLPSDWSPSNDLIDWAKKERPDLNTSTEIEAFKDYWKSVAGQKGRRLDWNATFRNWIRKADTPKKHGFSTQTSGQNKSKWDIQKETAQNLLKAKQIGHIPTGQIYAGSDFEAGLPGGANLRHKQTKRLFSINELKEVSQ